ncbi:MAG: hypothetical protein ACOZAJ_04565 [Patescibacteria group bacterium]
MIDKKFFNNLKLSYKKTQATRYLLSNLAGEAQRLSKQSIFAAQRQDINSADDLLKAAASLLKKGQGFIKKVQDLENLGVYRAALEEYVEAKLFLDVLKGQPIAGLTGFKILPEVYLGAVSDLVGEMVRLAVNYAAQSKIREVKELQALATELVSRLAEFNLTGRDVANLIRLNAI